MQAIGITLKPLMGRGAPDGVGATVKHMADAKVHQGHDCPDGKAMYSILKSDKCQIQLYFISKEQIEESVEELIKYKFTFSTRNDETTSDCNSSC